MTAVENFHFDVQEYFMHTFQLPTFREDTKYRKGKEKKITSLDKIFTRSLICPYEHCSFLFLFVCLFQVEH